MSELRRCIGRQVKQARLAAELATQRLHAGDIEALHDIRVGIRTVDSVLTPVWRLPGMKPVRQAFAPLRRWSRKYNALRDIEAQLALLQALLPTPWPLRLQDWFHAETARVAASHRQLVQDADDKRLLAGYRWLRKVCRQRLSKTREVDLRAALEQQMGSLLAQLYEDCTLGMALFAHSGHWHQTRIRAKRLRYLIAGYPRQFEAMSALQKRAGSVQSTLGQLRDWLALRPKIQGRLGAQEAANCDLIQARLLAASADALAALGLLIAEEKILHRTARTAVSACAEAV
ncbi:CHAD domain-containing protein [Chitinimonas viridis]|uniref:CHAD domain-containing protein n=1 Tax=Chitinimonas viridis TaxID=664880 RepID=A0ABT8B4E9_9NEIS|nr:CHAD domain-containing protein [Chitinimonas viridis]MDN3577133.1 CHAD domain-containing protein [Chitinimonas viridis]